MEIARHFLVNNNLFMSIIILLITLISYIVMHFCSWAIRRILSKDILPPNIIPINTMLAYSLFMYILTAFSFYFIAENRNLELSHLFNVGILFLIIILIIISIKINKVYSIIFNCYSNYRPMYKLHNVFLNYLIMLIFVLAGVYAGASGANGDVSPFIISGVLIYVLAIIPAGLIYQFLHIKNFGEVGLSTKSNTYVAGYLINESKYGFKIKTFCGALLFIPKEEVTEIRISLSGD